MSASLANLDTTIGKLEAALDRIESKLGGAPAAGGSAGDAPALESASVKGWDEDVAPLLNEWYALSEKIGADAAAQAAVAKETFDRFREVLIETASQAKPAGDAAMAKLGELLGPVGAKLGEVQAFSNKRSDAINHLKAVAEGIASLSWVADSLPAPFIDNARASSEFWSNKILREFKGKDENQVRWVTVFNDMLKAMAAYAKRVHTQGLVWKR